MSELNLKELATSMEAYKNNIEQQVKGISDTSSEQFKSLKTELDKVNENIAQLQKQITSTPANFIPGFDDSEKEQKKFSIANMVFGIDESRKMSKPTWKDYAPYEFEVCNTLNQKASIVGNPESMGYLIPNTLQAEIIGLTMPNMAINQLGADVMTGLVGSLYLNKKLTRNTAYFVGETEAPTPSGNTYGQIMLSEKRIGCFDKLSQSLSRQTRQIADAQIKQSIAEAMAIKMQQAVLYGTGLEKQPKGILNSGYSMITCPNQATNGKRFSFDGAMEMIQALDEQNELGDGGRYGFLMKTQAYWGLKRERVQTFSGQPLGSGIPAMGFGMATLSDEAVKNLLGYSFARTTEMPLVTKGTSTTCSDVIFGDFSKLILAMWDNMSIRTSDVAGNAFTNNEIYIVAFQSFDVALKRDTAFCKRSDAETLTANWSV